MKANIDKIGFGLSMASILGSIYAYTVDENLGIFIGLWASAIMIGSKRIHDWYNWGISMTNHLHDEMACWRKHLKDCRLEDEVEKQQD